MIALSLAGMIGAGMLRVRLQPRLGGWYACLAAAAAYVVAMIVVCLALPGFERGARAFPGSRPVGFQARRRGCSITDVCCYWSWFRLGRGARLGKRSTIANRRFRINGAALDHRQRQSRRTNAEFSAKRNELRYPGRKPFFLLPDVPS